METALRGNKWRNTAGTDAPSPEIVPNWLALARIHYTAARETLRTLLSKPDKTPRDLFMIAGLVCLTACVVVFVVGPVTSAIIYLAGKGIARG